MIGSEKASVPVLLAQHVFAGGNVEEGPLGNGVGFVGVGQASLPYSKSSIKKVPHPPIPLVETSSVSGGGAETILNLSGAGRLWSIRTICAN